MRQEDLPWEYTLFWQKRQTEMQIFFFSAKKKLFWMSSLDKYVLFRGIDSKHFPQTDILIKMTKLKQYFCYYKMVSIPAVCLADSSAWYPVLHPALMGSSGLDSLETNSEGRQCCLSCAWPNLLPRTLSCDGLDLAWTQLLWPGGSGEAFAHLSSLNPEICGHFSPPCWLHY